MLHCFMSHHQNNLIGMNIVHTGKLAGAAIKRTKFPGESTYKPGPGLSLDVIRHLKSIYEELSADILLKKCLHGKNPESK